MNYRTFHSKKYQKVPVFQSTPLFPGNDTPFSISGKDFTIYTRNCLMNKYFRPETLKRSPSAIKSSILITFSRHKERELPLKIRMFVNKLLKLTRMLKHPVINRKCVDALYGFLLTITKYYSLSFTVTTFPFTSKRNVAGPSIKRSTCVISS